MTESTLWHDPIVAEIHATRERLASQFKNDLVAYSAAAEAHCRVLGFQFVEVQRSTHHNAQDVVTPVVHT